MDDTDYEGYSEHLKLHRMLIRRKESKVFNREQLEANKFYVGSNSIFTRKWGHATEAEAVEHAQRMLSEDQSKSEVFIVEIIKVVRRKPVDVDIEEV